MECPLTRWRRRANGSIFALANDRKWPGAASCNGHTQLQCRQAAIGGTRPVADLGTEEFATRKRSFNGKFSSFVVARTSLWQDGRSANQGSREIAMDEAFEVVTDVAEISRLNRQLANQLRAALQYRESREITYPAGHHTGTVYLEASAGTSVRAWSPHVAP